jgi:hypothetical protein
MCITCAGSIVTKTLLFLCRLCYRVMHSQSHYLSSVLQPHLSPCGSVVRTQEWPPHLEYCYLHPGVRSWKTSVIIVWCVCDHRQTMWRYRLWLWRPGLGKDLYIKWKIYVPGRQLLAIWWWGLSFLPLLELCFMGHMARGCTLSPPSRAPLPLAAVKVPVTL